MLVLAELLVVSVMTSYSLPCWNYRTQKGIFSKESSKNLILLLLSTAPVLGEGCSLWPTDTRSLLTLRPLLSDTEAFSFSS